MRTPAAFVVHAASATAIARRRRHFLGQATKIPGKVIATELPDLVIGRQ
jgi:hypothetical protein